MHTSFHESSAVVQAHADFAAAIGNTPLIRLRAASEATGCEIFGKAEWLNPGGSIKDRTALGLLDDAERRGLIRPGGMLIEGTAGNTGIGLALLGNSRGYRSIIVAPITQSAEKIAALRMTGAEVRLVPAVPFKDGGHYVHVARPLAEEHNAETPGSAWFADQFDNTANRDVHETGTGPEIWEQTAGRIDGFVCSSGTGGTDECSGTPLAGMARSYSGSHAAHELPPKLAARISDPNMRPEQRAPADHLS